jgi:putative DNA primase/helicase
VFEGDEELIAYIQRAVGYTLTGCVNEQHFHVLFGEGQNGKTVLLNVLTHILGPHAFALPFAAFEKTSRSAIPHDLAATAGKRLITAAEIDERVTLNEARLKAMTGGDTQAARFLYQNTFNFRPTAKVWLIVNRKPVVTDDSDALWRGVRLVPFLVHLARTGSGHGLCIFAVNELLSTVRIEPHWPLVVPAGMDESQATGCRAWPWTRVEWLS